MALPQSIPQRPLRNGEKIFLCNLVLVVWLSLLWLMRVPNFRSVVSSAKPKDHVPQLSLSSTATVASASRNADETGNDTTYERDQDEKEAEELLNSQCKKVEHLCYSTGRWWFKSVSNLTAASQPNLIFHIHEVEVAFPRTIEVGPETPELSTMKCPYSFIVNHVSVAAFFNHMLGEFYARDLVGLAWMLEKSSRLSQQAQVYLHLWDLDRKILDSQRAFLAPLLRHHVLDFRELLQSSGCSCLERLYLCGYSFKEEEWLDTWIQTVQALDRLAAIFKRDDESSCFGIVAVSLEVSDLIQPNSPHKQEDEEYTFSVVDSTTTSSTTPQQQYSFWTRPVGNP